jgi:hypothetical protein
MPDMNTAVLPLLPLTQATFLQSNDDPKDA